MGFRRRFGRTLTVRLGARAQRDLAVDATDLGLEVSLNYRRSLGSGNFRSRLAQLYVGLQIDMWCLWRIIIRSLFH